MKTKFLWLICSFCLLLLVAVACQTQTVQDETISQVEILGPEPDVNITLIQHDSCPWSYFWCVVDKGINDAAKDLNVNVTLLRPNRNIFNPQKEKQLIEKTLADKTKPDGIGVTIIDRELLREPLRRAIDLGIPVIAYNAGSGPDKDDIPYLTYIGADEYKGGYQSGLKLADKLAKKGGKRRGVCISHLPKAENLKARCNGFLKAMKERGIKAEAIPNKENLDDDARDFRDPVKLKDYIKDYYKNHRDVDIFLTLGPIGATSFYDFIEEERLQPDKIAYGTFDLSRRVVDKIEDGKTLFAVDQQPYLEGYMVVQWLTWKIRHAFSPPAKIISTGPSFVDKSNIETVQAQVGQYR